MIEVVLALYTFIRYKPSKLKNLAIVFLLFLATFQMAEYFVCGGIGLNALVWSRVGYVAVTFSLPLRQERMYLLLHCQKKQKLPTRTQSLNKSELFTCCSAELARYFVRAQTVLE